MARVFTAHTPLGADMLLFESLTGREELSRLFEFRLELLSPSQDITAEQVLGKNVTIEVETEPHGRRYLNGEVTRFAYVSRFGRYYRYEAILRPWTWYMTRASNCRIFQKRTAIEIIEDVFFKYADVSSWGLLNRTSDSYRQWDFCVQYQETDFNFVSRMMEHEGIYYYFEHENGKHTLVLADSPGAHKALPEYEKIPFYAPDAAVIANEEHVHRWVVTKEVDPGGYTTDDYDFRKPRAKLEQRKQHPLGHANDRYKFYDYPGGYVEPAPDGERYAKVRLEELQAPHESLTGYTNVRGIAPGYHFNLYRCSRGDQNREYLILAADYYWKEAPYTTQGELGTVYETTMSCQDYSLQFRPARITPKPLTSGPQTAVVVGPKNEEIYTDEDGYGRVKVQFRWDREGKHDENSSCWIRVSNAWAGSNYGVIHVPRIGQEVIVDFIDGDPDYPIITGRVYNADEMPPWPLPAHKTQSGILTRSSMRGTTSNANLIRFEDKKGAEEIRVHAEKDLVVSAEHNEVRNIGNNRDVTIGNNHTEKIGKNMQLRVESDQDISIGSDKTETIEGKNDFHVQRDRNEKVDGTTSLTVGMNQQEKVGMNHALDAGMEIHLKAGMTVVIEAGVQLSLKAAGGFVDIGPAGVTIQGTMVMINSGGAAGNGSGSSPTAANDAKKAEPVSTGQP